MPVCDKDFTGFGGNTTCMSIWRDDIRRRSIIDAGTGIVKLGKEIASKGLDQDSLILGFTHFHWDHIQGFPFFAPAYDPDQVIEILAVGKGRKLPELESIFSVPMETVYFPVPLRKMGAQFKFLHHDANDLRINQAHIRVIEQNHPGGSTGVRIEADGRILVICTDVEHEGESVSEEVVDLARDADLLVHDAQYTDEELVNHRGWGHSSYSQAIEVAEKAGVKQLVMTHHDPDHNDEFLRKQEQLCQERMKDCCLAREGMEIDLS